MSFLEIVSTAAPGYSVVSQAITLAMVTFFIL
jgi:hypothetical protein